MTAQSPTPDWQAAALDALRAELARRELSYAEHDGEIRVPFHHDDGRRVVVVCRTGTTPDHGLLLVGAPLEPIAREHWPATLVALNHWNTATTGVKAGLHAENWATDDAAVVLLSVSLPVGPDGAVAADQVQAVVAALLTACACFLLPDLVTARAAEESS